MPKVLITDPISDKGLDILIDAGIELIYGQNYNDDQIKNTLSTIDGWLIRSGTKITEDHLLLAKKLQVIGRAGVGTDNIDIKAATNMGVIVMNMPDGNTISAAEHTIALISALSRNIHLGHLGLINSEWNRHSLVGNELRGKVLGVVGLGRIGREVIKRALGFEMKILGYDPFLNKEMFDPEKIKVVDLDDLTRNSDFITVHVPLTENTIDLFDSEKFDKMKTSARIINVARGGIINENDLVKALNSKAISGAALDVFVNEPLDSNHPLIKAQNILLSPHLGASTFEAKEGVSLGICKQIRDFLLEDKLSNPINMPISDMSKLKILKPFLDLTEKLGHIQSQLSSLSIRGISIECFGEIDEGKTLTLSFLKGLLKDSSDLRLNFVNVAAIAEERGISFSHSYNSDSVSFSNLIVTKIVTDEGVTKVSGSVFSENHYRLVEIKGFKVDVIPDGVMLLIQNKDVPGVIGKVGMVLGNKDINIAEYLLSRDLNNASAFSIVKIDEKLSESVINELKKIDDILNIEQLKI